MAGDGKCREADQHDVRGENVAGDVGVAHPAFHRLLIIVLPVGAPDPLAAHESSADRDAAVGQVVCGQDQCRERLSPRRDLEQQPAEQEAERLRLARERAEANQRRATLREEYVATIQELVRRNWLRPPTADPGVRCAVRVVQIPGGVITDQAIASPCNADPLTRESILSAVQRTEQLPYEGYEEVFEREIVFIFRYDGN